MNETTRTAIFEKYRAAHPTHSYGIEDFEVDEDGSAYVTVTVNPASEIEIFLVGGSIYEIHWWVDHRGDMQVEAVLRDGQLIFDGLEEERGREWHEWAVATDKATHGRVTRTISTKNPHELVRELIRTNNDHYITNLPCPPDWDEAGWPWTCLQGVVDLKKARRQFEDAVRKMTDNEQAQTFSGKVRWTLTE